MINTEYVPWIRLAGRRLLVMGEETARVEPAGPASSCQHPNGCWTGYGFPSHPSIIVPICPDCLAILGKVIHR